jgi:hypothetical protein
MDRLPVVVVPESRLHSSLSLSGDFRGSDAEVEEQRQTKHEKLQAGRQTRLEDELWVGMKENGSVNRLRPQRRTQMQRRGLPSRHRTEVW